MPNKSDPLKNMEDKRLVPHSCQSCGKLYYVFRDEGAASEPIKACCVCRYPKKPYLDTFQAAAMFRSKSGY